MADAGAINFQYRDNQSYQTDKEIKKTYKHKPEMHYRLKSATDAGVIV